MAISPLIIPARTAASSTGYAGDMNLVIAKINELATSMAISPLTIAAAVGAGSPAADMNQVVAKINEIIAGGAVTPPTGTKATSPRFGTIDDTNNVVGVSSDYSYTEVVVGLEGQAGGQLASNSIFSPGNVAGRAFAYVVANGSRLQSDTVYSAPFTMAATANNAPTATISVTGGTTTVTPGQSVVLQLAGADTDAGDSVPKIEALDNGVKIGEISGASGSLQTPALTAGTHSFTARAYDSKGTTGLSQAVVVKAQAAGGKVPLILAFGNSQTYGPYVGAGDTSLIGSASTTAWPDVMLADLNASSVQYAAKVFGHSGQSTVSLIDLLQTEVKPWLADNASKYSSVTVILQELVNDANNSNPPNTEDQVYQHFAQLIADTKALPTVNYVSMLTGYINTAGATTNGLIVNVNKRLKENRNTLGIKQVFDVRTLKYVLDMTGGAGIDGLHLSDYGNGLVGHFVANGIRSGASVVVDPTYVAPIVFDFKNQSFEVPAGTDPAQNFVVPDGSGWIINGNGDATITNGGGIFYQDVPLVVGSSYKVVVDATVTNGSISVHGNSSGTPNHVQVLPGAGVVPFKAVYATERLTFEAPAGTTATIHYVGIAEFVPSAGSVGKFNNSTFANPEDGTDHNWKHYTGWIVNGDGKASFDSSTPGAGQMYLYQIVEGLDITKQYRLRIRGAFEAGSALYLDGYGQVGIGQDLLFTPKYEAIQFILNASGKGYLTNVILALDDANFPAG